jgi:transposase
MLTHEFGKWKTVYHYFWQWRNDGTWQRIHERLRQWVRTMEYERPPSPSAGVVDSQSVPTAVMVSADVGYDGGKKACPERLRWVKGRKRHILVDTLGLLVVAVVKQRMSRKELANRSLLLRTRELPVHLERLIVLYVDGSYRGNQLFEWVIATFHGVLEWFYVPTEPKAWFCYPSVGSLNAPLVGGAGAGA